MKNELFTIGPFTVYGYGTMIALGVLAAYITAEYRARKQKLPYEHVFFLVIWCVLGGFAGAKLLFWITEFRRILEDPGFMIRTFRDGFVVYGGILGGILAGYLYCRKKGLVFLKFFDLVMPSIALAQGIGRIGCLLAGCCYGKETDSFPSITFYDSAFAPNGVPLIPTQIYASVLDFLHFFLLLFLAKRKKADGQIAACYLCFYSLGRFILEFFRGDLLRGSVGILSTSQFISIFTGAGGLILLAAVLKRNKKQEKA
ncbi:MAG TPA: prolipoprotein diacylglyceryl transferase [Candidatus Blautia faecavium]|uniref:Phosphatidylglycerol--prolipoprotein diacylglyceryl transferase n=1 Tax=Candidatus Blautia faecavium TaxID=2838487 RepID=A0A9D2LS70_9FIRM|nr:prolipoprotein diacylglyceryl transferase [Candidatus Blautia faecavium]